MSMTKLTNITVPADSDIATHILNHSAQVDPVWAAYRATGAPMSGFSAYRDRATRPTDTIPNGFVWYAKELIPGTYYILRDRAPMDEDRYEYTPSGRWRSYKSEAAAIKAAAKRNS